MPPEASNSMSSALSAVADTANIISFVLGSTLIAAHSSSVFNVTSNLELSSVFGLYI